MKKTYSVLSVCMILLFVGCSDAFLDKAPLDQLSEPTTFTTDANFETYCWGFYNTFPGFDLTPTNNEWNGDLMCQGSGSIGRDWLWQNVVEPNNADSWTDPYERIRRINLMLSNLEGSQLDEEGQKHWRSVGYFFRAYEHFQLLIKYGEFIYLDELVNETDLDVLYGPKTSRDEIAAMMLADLEYAEANIRAEGDNVVDQSVVRALISRFGLFEGTWRKYHSLGDETKYLRASADAGMALAQSFPNLHGNYDQVFNSTNLNGTNGILLYKAYEFDVMMHIHTSRHRNSAGNWDITKRGIDKFLCKDGETIWTSAMFEGDVNAPEDPYTEFRNRDERLYYMTPPPYQVVPTGQKTWEYDPDPKHREYIDLMSTLSDANHKPLPLSNWQGIILKQEPHYRKSNKGQGFMVSYTGYRFHKYYNEFHTGIQNKEYTDFPVFRMGEVLVNLAEALFELGEFDQDAANLTINKLRARGNVAALDIANFVDDPTRDADVDRVLWEIRRERAVELMGEGFRFDDIRRWRKAHEYGALEKLGRYVNNANFGNKLPIQGGASVGFVSPWGVPPGFPEHYYLYPIPLEELALNEKLVQNPGWKRAE
ncbi:RagB/SusD family nutrient uptake outer membrane protein [Carboxylicivirga sediminis]|uniref:RagB/SusD family nutrient uptake outer membrane protein n=1 Tax=Carboxylicivirga sediminis TaxID=2006564 RepID=A0A941F3B3_9BACT|nr:RagB/SusD family nutrient uptake outer membrane protein [Carboxylicivirga sediminis]MBR8535642.1 RagB/SusD family nutrient uptake outer membrane protein [Carboxylicivirga sediminis]